MHKSKWLLDRFESLIFPFLLSSDTFSSCKKKGFHVEVSCSWGRSKPATLVENNEPLWLLNLLTYRIHVWYSFLHLPYNQAESCRCKYTVRPMGSEWVWCIMAMVYDHLKEVVGKREGHSTRWLLSKVTKLYPQNVGSFTFFFQLPLKRSHGTLLAWITKRTPGYMFGWIFDECTELTGQGLFLKKIRPPRFPFVASCVPSQSTWGHKLSWMWRILVDKGGWPGVVRYSSICL